MASLRRCPPLLAAALLLAGCDAHSVCFLCGGADSGTGPELDLFPTTLDFGPVSVGETRHARLFLCNLGGATLSIVSAEVVGGSSTFRVGRVEDLLLQARDRTTLDIEFTPWQEGTARDELVVESTDPEESLRSVLLLGDGQAPELDVAPDAVDLGTVQIGCTREADLVVYNVGNLFLEVEAVDLEIFTGGIGLSLDTPVNGPLPWSIPPEDHLTLGRVVFAPLDDEATEGVVRILSNDPIRPRVEVPVRARAEEWAHGLDTWTFPAVLVDVVAAVDVTADMDVWNADFAAHAGTLASSLDAAGADWRLAVVAADDGCVEGRQAYLASGASPDDVARGVATMLDVRAGSLARQAFTLLDLALTESALAAEGCNAGLLRAGAGLHLVGMSGAEDRSPGTWSGWVAHFQDRVDDPLQVAFHGIGSPPDDPCPDLEDYARFRSASLATGGAFVPLCTADWDASLAELVDGMVDAAPGVPAEAAWPLSRVPVPGTLRILLDGSTLPGGWTWSEEDNTVRFEAGAAPRAGVTVTVSYAVAGPCEAAQGRSRAPAVPREPPGAL